jgi:hypothetical protein
MNVNINALIKMEFCVKTIVLKLMLNVLAFFIVSLPVSANIPQVLFEKAGSWVKPFNVSLTSKVSTDGSVRYLLFDNQIDIRNQRKVQFFHYATQPISEQGLTNISQVEVRFSPKYEKLVFHDIQVFRHGKRIDKLDITKLKVFQQEDQLKDNLYSENWIALFILEDIRVGDVIDYSYSIVGSNPILGEKKFGSSSLDWAVPVEMTNFRLISDAKKELQVAVHNSKKTFSKKITADISEYVLTQRNVQAVREDDYAPQWFTPYSYLTYSQYDGWEEVNDWAEKLYGIDLTLPVELIEILEKHKTSNSLESATKMIQWVQDNIRYFGIEMGVNSHQPSPPLETFSRRYGDCKDKAILLIAILKYFNIEAYPVLVSTITSKMLPDETPSPGAFNHVIVTFNVDDKDYWVDATVSNQRGSLDEISFPNLYWGLVVKDETKKLTPITPFNDEQLRGSINVRQKLVLGEDIEKSKFTVDTEYSGWQAEQLRSYIDRVGVQESSNDHLDYLTKYFPEIQMQNPIVVKDNTDGNNILVSESYYVDKFTKNFQSNDKLTIYATQILDNIWLPNIRQRQAPFVLPYYLDINVEIQIVAKKPKDVIWFDELKARVNKNKWFTYARNIEERDGVISVIYEYKSLLPEVSADEFNQYASLLEDVEESLSYSLLLRKNVATKDNNARAKSLVKMLMNKNK